MGKLFYIIGKSASGKDSVFNELLSDPAFPAKKIIQYTTRPKRGHETEGVEYHFITEEAEEKYEAAGRIIEKRTYQTVHGPWSYMMIDDGQIDLASADYLAVGTAESFAKVARYFGKDRVFPIYVDVETGERLFRALMRERKSNTPKYAEMCRRFLADEADFSDEKLKEAGIMTRSGRIRNLVENDDFEKCVEKVRRMILKEIRKEHDVQ